MSTIHFQLGWKVHTPNLLREVLSNPSASILSIPMSIFGNLLYEVGNRAAELNDPILNDLMCRLTLYAVADPESPHFSPEALKLVSEQAQEFRANQSTKSDS